MNLSEHVTLYIHQATDDGKPLVDFLVDTMKGRTPYAKFSHQFKAVELLTLYGGFIPDQIPTLDNLPARNDSDSNASGKPAKKAKKHKVTEKQLLNYDVIRMIKQDTRNGELLVDLLIHVAINGKMSNSRRFISPSTRMRAAQELLARGFGAVSPRRIPSGKNEGLGATISKRIRKDTDNGREAAAYLMDIVIGNPPTQAKPSKRKRFTPHRRVLAACELLRRLCDIRTDHITPEHIQAYWTSQTPIDARAREAKANAGRPDINRTGIDKATALAAMAAKPAAPDERDNTAASEQSVNNTDIDTETQTAAAVSEPSNTTDKPAAQDPFPHRGKARMGASPDNTPTTDGEARDAAAAKPASDDHHNTAPDSSAETHAAANDASSVKPHDNTTTAVSKPSTLDAAETQAAANASDERETANAVSADKPAAQDPFPPRGKAGMGASPAAISAQTPVAAAAKPAISEPPTNTADASNPPATAAGNSHTNASAHKSASDASKPSNTAKPADAHTPITPSHPTPFAPKSSTHPPKLTRRQRRKANKRKQRRAKRKARSP